MSVIFVITNPTFTLTKLYRRIRSGQFSHLSDGVTNTIWKRKTWRMSRLQSSAGFFGGGGQIAGVFWVVKNMRCFCSQQQFQILHNNAVCSLLYKSNKDIQIFPEAGLQKFDIVFQQHCIEPATDWKPQSRNFKTADLIEMFIFVTNVTNCDNLQHKGSESNLRRVCCWNFRDFFLLQS